MTVRVAINGLGRIGRCILRAYSELNRNDIEIVAVNGPAAADVHAHLLKYDSVHGTFGPEVKFGDDVLDFGKGKIKLIRERDLNKVNWKEHNIDVVLECTGAFTKAADAGIHLKNGAKKVIISAPSPDPHRTVVMGVNQNEVKKEDTIISIGSCTTNCLAPVVKVLLDNVGIEAGHMTTIHSFTNDQVVLDGNHKDLRRARASSMSMIPTTTGAASSMGKIFPTLKGKIDGTAIRVPTPNVSLVDFTFTSSKETSKDEINNLMKKYAAGAMKGVLEVNEKPLVSRDFNHHPASSIFDATGTNVIGGKLCRVASWYDNEWGFSVRMIDAASFVMKL